MKERKKNGIHLGLKCVHVQQSLIKEQCIIYNLEKNIFDSFSIHLMPGLPVKLRTKTETLLSIDVGSVENEEYIIGKNKLYHMISNILHSTLKNMM